MNYWLFVDNNIIGPLDLKEIVNSKYFNPKLLLCPYEMDANSPSNWYFAKELVEFEPYLKSSVAVSDLTELTVENIENWYRSQVKNSEVRDLMMGEAAFYENIIVENNVLKEKINIKDKEIDDYKRKVLSLEIKISKIGEELDKTLDVIKKYEETINFKDKEIERLSLEIKEIKDKLDKKYFEKYKDELDRKDAEIKTLKEELDILKKKSLPIDKEVIEKLETDNNIELKEEKSESEEKNIDIFVNDSLTLSENIDLKPAEKEFLIVDEKKDEMQVMSFETKDEANQNTKDIDNINEEKISDEIKFNDPFVKPISQLKAINIEEAQDDENNQISVEEFDNLNLKLSSVEKDNSIFQIADIKLDVAKVNLDVVDSKKLEVVESNIENLEVIEPVNQVSKSDEKNQKENQELIKEDIKIGNIEEVENDKKEQIVADESLKSELKINIREVEEEKIEEKNKISSVEYRKPDVVLNDKVQQNNEIKKDIKSSVLVLTKKKSKFKTPLLIFSSILFISVFAGSIIYILKSGSNDKEVLYSTKIAFPKNDTTVEQKDNKISDEKTNDDINISKINENILKAINIVKSYELGGGKGTIDRWFSNVFTAGGQAKEEWNATYLNKNLFVVQYRVLKYKSEPVVYLFEVDVEDNKIVRGINNNAIELLSGKDIWKEKKSAKVVSKEKIMENMEKDDEMF